MILNLGAGGRLIEGAINHDIIKHRPEIDAVWNLNQVPWPWGEGEFEAIEAIHVFEHLKLSLLETANECWRIIRRGGLLTVKFPIVASPTIYDDPTHRWFWSARVLEYLDPDTDYGSRYRFYTDRHWQIVSSGIIKGRNLKAVLRPRK